MVQLEMMGGERMEGRLENLKRMLNPRHLVLIGGKNIIQKGIQNCKKIGFQGEIYAVNKTEMEIEGVRCYKNINELPRVPDAAFIAIRADRAVEAIKELRTMGTFGCVCYAAGFSEVGNNHLHKDLIEAAGDMALIGPNCYGVINYLDQVPLWADRFGSEPTDKGVAIISQSGNLSFNITMNGRSLPLAYALSIGNQAVLDIADYMMAMCDDPRVTAIGLHIEGLGNMEKFIQAAKTALEKGIPIVAYKTGVSEIGSQLTMSHTSSLAGSDDLYQALFKRLNICRVDSLSAFLETLKLFSVAGSIEGRNVGVLTVSGGESAITADEAAKNGFSLPDLTAKQREELKSQLTKFEHVSNPLDYNMSIWGDEEKLVNCFTSFMQEQFHTTLLIFDYLDNEYRDMESWEAVVNAYIQVHKQTRTQALVISVLPEGMPIHFREKFLSNGITPLQGMTDAFTAINAVTVYNERRRNNFPVPSNLLLPKDRPQENEGIVLDEWQGKQALLSYGVKVPYGKMVSIEDEHLIDEGMAGPFVAKGVSAKVAHKTDIGAVKLKLQTEEEVRQALLDIHKNLADKMDVDDIRLLVEEMIPNAVAELNIGIKRDDQFGLALVISMGGILVNLVNDSVPVLLPASREEILEALYSLKGIKLVTGFRGSPKGDIEAVVKAAESVAAYAEAHRNNILEMEINPLLVLPEGQGAVAVDAFIRTVAGTVKTEEPSVQKIMPY
ncbi:acetate--CoA ligase family protein [Bacillus sp. S3]|nr:acetate--CoA ligase family protein [Bacillus sp. S3]